MLQKDHIFARSSENERRFRISICTVGLIFILYTAATFFAELVSNDEVRDFFIRSAFMVSEIPSEISGFTK